MNEEPTLSKYQESYIKLIAKETAKEIADEVEKRLGKHIADNKKEIKRHSDRLQKVEQKVFNGFGLKLDKMKWQIGLLYGIYTIIIGVLIKIAFFGGR